jgi:hypothetical protein
MSLKQNIKKIFKAVEGRNQYEATYLQIRALSLNDSALFEIL